MLLVLNTLKGYTMIPNINFFAGAAACAFGGVLSVSAINKYSSKVLEGVSPILKTAVPSFALLLTVDAISQYAEETSPFWKGVAWAVPTLAVTTAEVIGMTGAEAALAKNNPEVLSSNKYKEQMSASDWKHSLLVAMTVCFASRVPKMYSLMVASLFGSLVGNVKVIRAADLARETLKKDV